ncbi:MAG: ParB/RepB/Spo0J family partition protein [Alphaproteobacteria bacterium]|nr:ParB/RepB/Spo0J family partition protein [Alphaproteobacteria bacterium]
MSENRTNLGRGLSALLGDNNDDIMGVDEEVKKDVTTVKIDFLHPSPYQPRLKFDEDAIADLVESVREKGVLQPLLVRKSSQEENMYEIIAGERRWQASRRAGLHEVPVLVKEFSDEETLEVALIENLQRQDLSPLEEAKGYKRLMDEFSHTQEILAKGVGKSRSHVANMMRLLELPDNVKDFLDDGALSAGHARALLGSKDPAELVKNVVSKGLNVRQTEKLVKSEGKKRSAPKKPKSKDKDADTIALEQDMSHALGMKVSVNFKGRGGEVSIAFDNFSQLDEIVSHLTEGTFDDDMGSAFSPEEEMKLAFGHGADMKFDNSEAVEKGKKAAVEIGNSMIDDSMARIIAEENDE